MVELVQAGRPVRMVAAELGLAEATVYRWKAQDLIDRGVKPGTSTSERGELAAARRRIQEFETELALSNRPRSCNATEPLFARSVDGWSEATARWTRYPESGSAPLLVVGDARGSTADRIRRGVAASLLTPGEAEDLIGAFEQVFQLRFEQGSLPSGEGIR